MISDPCRQRPWCPVCGVFGRKARRLRRKYDGEALVRFHVKLAADIRAERKARR